VFFCRLAAVDLGRLKFTELAGPEVHNHSARVHMELRLDGSVLDLSHLGPDHPMLAQPVDCPPAGAGIVMFVDGKQSRWPVRLPAGLSVGRRSGPARRDSSSLSRSPWAHGRLASQPVMSPACFVTRTVFWLVEVILTFVPSPLR
jgi:hypothetical protein